MALGLTEFKKMSQSKLIAAVFQTFLDESPIMNYMQFDQIPGGSVTFNRQKTLPETGFRAIGVAYTSAAGELEQVTEELKIVGGKITIDRALPILQGPGRFVAEQQMQLISQARTVNAAFYKGDGTGGSFTGLQSRATNTINNGTAALSLANLDKAVINCKGSNKVIFMNKQMYLRLNTAAKSTTLGSQITITPDQFGVPITRYAGVPVVMAGEDYTGSEVLGFTEASSTTSIYVVSFDPNGMVGVENGGVREFTPKSEDVASEFDIEWYVNYIIGNPAAVQRLYGITDAAVVA